VIVPLPSGELSWTSRVAATAAHPGPGLNEGDCGGEGVSPRESAEIRGELGQQVVDEADVVLGLRHSADVRGQLEDGHGLARLALDLPGHRVGDPRAIDRLVVMRRALSRLTTSTRRRMSAGEGSMPGFGSQ